MFSGSLALLYAVVALSPWFSWLVGPPAWLAGPQAWLDGPEGGTDGQTNKWTNRRKISPFYRTLSPIGAAALPPPMKTKEKVEQGKGTADHLMPLGYFFVFCFRSVSVSLSVCRFWIAGVTVCQSVCQSVCLLVGRFVHLSVRPSNSLLKFSQKRHPNCITAPSHPHAVVYTAFFFIFFFLSVSSSSTETVKNKSTASSYHDRITSPYDHMIISD